MDEPTRADPMRAEPPPEGPRQWPRAPKLAGFEIADAVWLASRSGFGPPSTEDSEPPGAVLDGAGGADETAEPSADPPALPTARPPADDEPYYLPAPPDTSGPAAAETWVGPLAGGSAAGSDRVPSRADTLSSLRLTVGSPVARELDEEATAELGVVTQRWIPVLRPTDERRWDVVVVIDESPLIDAWHDAVADFVAGLRRQAAFRTIQLRWLGEGERGSLTLRSAPDGAPRPRPASSTSPDGGWSSC